MEKGLSMAGAASLEIERRLHDYRYRHNRDLFHSSRTGWVKLWVSWRDVQPAQPRDRAESWTQLTGAPALHDLDAQIAAANADGVRVVLALDEFTPAWASGAAETEARPPANCSPNGPWAWFIEHLCARYRIAAGNPAGAYVDALEICNEPNLRWPQDGAPEVVADMIRTAAQLCVAHGRLSLWAPSLSDIPEERLIGPWGHGTPLQEFAERVIAASESVPAGTVSWSQHNYGDIAAGDARGVRAALDVLEDSGWPGWDGTIRLTEGACLMEDPRTLTLADAILFEAEQADLLRRNFEASAGVDQVALWTHHSVHDLSIGGIDAGVYGNVKTGLFADFDWRRGVPGGEKLAWDVFAELSDRRPEAAVSEQPVSTGIEIDFGQAEQPAA